MLVMLVRSSSYPESIGQIGEIKSGLFHANTLDRRTGTIHTQVGYRVHFPNDPSRHSTGCWHVRPDQLIPITPPGKTDDVTHDIDNEVTA